MKNEVIWLTALMGMTATFFSCSPLFAASDKAKLTLSGVIKSNACTVANSAASFTLPDVSVSDFGGKTGANAGTTNISLKLTECGSDTGKVKLTASGTAAESVTAFANMSTANPVATGVGLTMFRNGAPLSVFRPDGSVTDEVVLTPGDNTLDFRVRLVSTSDTVTPGSFSTTINMKIDYY